MSCHDGDVRGRGMNRVAPAMLNQRFFNRIPTPSVAVLELTNRCNHECVHCVRESPLHDAHSAELADDEWFGILEDLAEIKTFAISFTGGEATLHPRLPDFVRRARALRMVVSVKSNGMLLPRMAQSLAAAGVGNMEVSLYGASAETHERCTKIRGSFALTVSGIRAAKAAGISVAINCTIFRWNAHEIDRLRELAASLDCPIQRDYFLMRTDIGREIDDFVSPEQVRWIESKWPGYVRRENQNGAEGIKICTQGVNVIGVTSQGEILSCVTIRKPIGHVREEGVVAAWGALTGRRAHHIDYAKFDRCRTCEYVSRCHTCLGQSYAATGDFYEPPLERCLITAALYGRVGDTINRVPEAVPRKETNDARVP